MLLINWFFYHLTLGNQIVMISFNACILAFAIVIIWKSRNHCYCQVLMKRILLRQEDFNIPNYSRKRKKKRWRKKSIQLKIVKIHTKTWNWLQFGANSKKVSSSKLPHSHVLYLVIVISRFDFKKGKKESCCTARMI